ncbi:MAG: hypothetical protein O3C57_08390 [Verrucomicrobia bacterium]|nr:hypothetical protein [Verrucomicrobiota bacterium]
MIVFFDTSAVVPLVVHEAHSQAACDAWHQASEAWAWDWLRLEGESALARRKASPLSWNVWRTTLSEFRLIGLTASQHPALCAFNRGLALRAADAAHLFVFDQILQHVPDALLLTFDDEMLVAAKRISLPLHPSCSKP